MPWHTFSRNFRMLTQVIEGVCRRRGVDSFYRVEGSFLCRLLLHTHASIQNRKVVVRSEVIRIDGLKRLELLHGFVAAVLLIVRDTELSASISRVRILRDHLLQVGDLSFGMPLPAFDKSEIVESPSVIRTERKRLLERSACLGILLPFNESDSNVDIAILVIRAQSNDVLKRIHRLVVLQLVEVPYADIIPAHPLRIVCRKRRGDLVLADIQCAASRGNFYHRIRRVVFAEYVVQIALPQVTVIDACRNRQWALRAWRNPKLITDERRPSGLDRVVVCHGMNRPHFVVVHKVPSHIYGTIGKTVGAFIQHAIRLQKAAIVNLRSGRIRHGELYPRFIKIADLWNKRMTDVLVLNHNVGFNRLVRLDCEWRRA